MNGKNHSKALAGRNSEGSSKPNFRRLIRFKALLFTCLFLVIGIKACFAQSINLQAKNQSLEQVIKQLRAQTDYSIMLSSNVLEKAKPVTITLKNASIEQALKEIFKSQPLLFEIKGKNIIVREKRTSEKQENENSSERSKKDGQVTDHIGNPISGATISSVAENISTSSDETGRFSIRIGEGERLLVKMIGFESQEVTVNGNIGTIRLAVSNFVMETANVVSTGYQSIPKERATGSFSTVSNELLNQQVSTDILSRIPNVANSVLMDQSAYNGQIMVRGLSTISGPKSPLVILDNFPFEGDINNINPNIVENITILKDASASSIWGARAANGVIVITTKKGSLNTPISIQINSNVSIAPKPDLDYIPQMSSSDFIDIETELFKRGFYKTRLNSRNRQVVSPVVNYLDRVDKGLLTTDEANTAINLLRNIDVRDQFDKYMYKPSVRQQYFVNAQGGIKKFSWLSSIGYDRNKENLGEIYDRLNIRFQNTYKPIKNISINTNLYYTQTNNASGRIGYSGLYPLFPYTQFADENGNAIAVPKTWNQSYLETVGNGKLLDWKYYPLTDWEHQTSKSSSSSILANTGLNYEIINGLKASIDYQYERQTNLSTSLADEDSFMARDYINRFSQIVENQVVYIVPRGGILGKGSNAINAHNLRGQLSFDKTFGRHNINAIAGAEMRTTKLEGNNTRYYGYNPNNLTTGNVDLTKPYRNLITGSNETITNLNSLTSTDRRFLSQFANAAYTLDEKYILSASIRRDASNLFGLKTNDQWNPFWSVGAAWKLSKEPFYNFEIFPYLNIRSTYGFSGNIDPAMVAVNTIRYLRGISLFTGTPVAQFNNFYNPELKWETSKMFNVAIDFQAKNNRLSGSVEYYRKKGVDLFGMSQIDYTVGVDPWMLRNVASMKGTGVDIELKSLNVDREFKWNTTLNFSVYRDKIENYMVNRNMAVFYISTSTPPISGVKGHPVYAIYAYKWAGLDPSTGEAQGYLNGEVSKDYTNIIGEGTALEELDYFGSAIPTKFGSMINTIAYKNFSLNIGLSFKLGYWFRRNSINYTNLFNNWQGHKDYEKRWQNPGDELTTYIPSNSYTTNGSRDQFFEGTSVLVERGDHVRLQYINFGYSFQNIKALKVLHFFVNASNLGLLWKANKAGLDPDFNLGLKGFVTPSNYSIGIRANF